MSAPSSLRERVSNEGTSTFRLTRQTVTALSISRRRRDEGGHKPRE